MENEASYCVHKSPVFVPTLIVANHFHTLCFYFYQLYFIIKIPPRRPNVLFLSRFLTKTFYAFISYYTFVTTSSQIILLNLISLTLFRGTNNEVLKYTLTLKDTEPKFRNKWSYNCFPP